MKHLISILLLTSVLMACSSSSKNTEDSSGIVIYQQEDKEILNTIFELFGDQQDAPASALVVRIGTFFKGTPYVGHTLESDKEQLIVNLRELDCTTYAENCLAIAKTIQSGILTFDKFTEELIRVRYRNGIIAGYPSRLHYFSDWIYNNKKKLIVKDVGEELEIAHYGSEVNFMSTHPESYYRLKDNRKMVKEIAHLENIISKRSMYYIPEDKLSGVEDQLYEGDIVGITTNVEGLDISHVGILVRENGRIHLMHASSAAKKVVISDITLEDYLLNSESATGVMVARPI